VVLSWLYVTLLQPLLSYVSELINNIIFEVLFYIIF